MTTPRGYTPEGWATVERLIEEKYADPPPVNVRAEQVHRIRQSLVNMRAACGTSLDDIDLATLGAAINDLVALEHALRD